MLLDGPSVTTVVTLDWPRAEHGQLGVLEWLERTEPEAFARAKQEEIIYYEAVMQGHVGVARWLLDRNFLSTLVARECAAYGVNNLVRRFSQSRSDRTISRHIGSLHHVLCELFRPLRLSENNLSLVFEREPGVPRREVTFRCDDFALPYVRLVIAWDERVRAASARTC